MPPNHYINQTSHRRQHGVGLIEILVALVIACLGFVGLASALTNSMKNNQSSMERSSAVSQAYSAMEILRTDKPNAIIGRYNLSQFTCNNVSGDNAIGANLNLFLEGIKSNVNATACGRIVCGSTQCVVDIRWTDRQNPSGTELYSARTRL